MAEVQQNIVSLERHRELKVLREAGRPFGDWTDEALMLEHGQGSEAAYTELLKRHQRPVLNYIFRLVGNRHVAEELTQDVFLALVKNGQRYQPTAKFTTYMYTIASNIVSKEWQRNKRRPRVLSISAPWSWNRDKDESFDPIEHVGDPKGCVQERTEKEEVSDAVNQALEHLPAHQREAFVLHRLQDMPYEDIASVTNTPIGTIKSRVVRAERALRPLLSSFREYLNR